MFPSGKWRGFWEAAGWGRRWMEPLELRFDDGRVEGEGSDCIGRFTFAGTQSGGVVRLVKQYIGKHSVNYLGRVDGEGVIVGQWTIGQEWSGPFALIPLIETVGELEIQELALVGV